MGTLHIGQSNMNAALCVFLWLALTLGNYPYGGFSYILNFAHQSTRTASAVRQIYDADPFFTQRSVSFYQKMFCYTG